MHELRDVLRDKAFLVLRQELTPLLGPGHPIAPPTFADARERYHIDWLVGEGLLATADVAKAAQEGRLLNRCVVDSFTAEAQRMRRRLKRRFRGHMPRVTVAVPSEARELDILDLSHQLTDATLIYSRFESGVGFRESPLGKALQAWASSEDATALARVAPVSLLFGFWDSHPYGGTNAKCRRALRAEIVAENVCRLERHSQRRLPISDETKNTIFDGIDKLKPSDVLLDHQPVGGLGGVVVFGRIHREVAINLIQLRNLDGGDGKLAWYLLNIAVAAAQLEADDLDLREGCSLGVRSSAWSAIGRDGQEAALAAVPLDDDALKAAAAEFFGGALPAPLRAELDVEFAKTLLKQQQQEKDGGGKGKKKGKAAAQSEG